MKIIKNTLFSVVLILILTNCAPSSEEIARAVNATIAAQATSIPTIIPTETPSENSSIDSDRESYLEKFLNGIIKDEKYDPSTNVLHKYIDGMYVTIEGSNVHIITFKDPGSPEEAADLAFESLLWAASVSSVENWGATSVDLIYPNLSNWEYRFSVDGPENIARVAENGYDALSEVMDFNLSPEVETAMAQTSYLSPEPQESSNTPVPPTKTIAVPTSTRVVPTKTRVAPTKTRIPTVRPPTRIPTAASLLTCGPLLTGSSLDAALAKIDFQMPNRYTVIKEKTTYASLPALFHLFVFKSSDSTIKGCINELLQEIASDSTIIKTDYDVQADPQLQSGPIAAFSYGTKNDSKNTIWVNAMYGFGYNNNIYLMVWDSLGEDEMAKIGDDILYTINSTSLY